MVATSLLPTPWAWFAGVAVFAAGFAQAWRLGLIGSRYSLRQLQCDSDGLWWVVSSTGIRLAVRFGDASRLGANIVWLEANSTTGTFWLLLLRFSAPDAVWRGLQTRLRWVGDGATTADLRDKPQDDSFTS
jgi:hypothetical protein